ncbi:hypothetical protein PV05_06122 [Exophiala xenobiotica]|uniref:RNase MRP protein 1 RNA binding domain-containing protein n=1 Tax=Exophiala xenobiotica TaxID=348802 RepID=A0A0D2BYU4_9EURO|nr:uncharacterized protein PV05_06122 [Exophiala xenobiotica]KIW57581.1 hypothetical protein PV05_06122 [Exophiala xenobiotica]
MSVQKMKGTVSEKHDDSKDVPARPSKRRKISHPSRKPEPQAKYSATTTKRSSRRRVLPQPPRLMRPEYSSSGPKSRAPSTSHSNSKPASGTSTPLTIADPSSKVAFVKSLLDQVWARNKNQHRTQPWWRSLGILKKAITQLVVLDGKQRQLRQRATAAVDAKTVRKRFEQEAQIRIERDVWNERIREVLVPRAYVGFTGLVADKQFANLGVVLVGVLADVMSVVGAPTPSKEETSTSPQEDVEDVYVSHQPNGKPRSLTATSLRITGLQGGELVERMYDSDDAGEVIERTEKDETPSDQRRRSISTTRGPKSMDGTAADATKSDPTELTASNDKEDADIGGSQADEEGPQTPQTEAQALSALGAATSHADSSLRSNLRSEPRASTSRGRDRPTSTTSKSSKEKKKKKGKKNAIDDLFAGLS